MKSIKFIEVEALVKPKGITKRSIHCPKSTLHDVLFFNPQLKISRSQIYFRE